jgi:hypothetical protein
MTEDQLREFLEANKADIEATVKERAVKSLLEEHRWTINSQISEAVNKFVEAEIIPVIREELVAQKGAIIEAALKSISTISDSLAEGMLKTAAKNIGDDWRRREIIKALFGV